MSGQLRHRVTAFGRTRSIKEWAQESGITEGCLRHRIFKLGMDPEKALTERVLTKREWGIASAHLLHLRARAKRGLPAAPRHEAWEGASTLSWDDDERAQHALAERGPMTHQQIGELLGLTRQRVQQIEAIAIRKLARLMDGDRDRVLEMLRSAAAQRDGRRSLWEEMELEA